MNRSVDFFDTQFKKQVAAADYALNPFETAVLSYVRGRVLDLGCGLGNLSVAAARAGAQVTALDASPTAVGRLRAVAGAEKLAIEPVLADALSYRLAADYDTIVAIGLLMFMPREDALRLLADIQSHVAPGGVAIINVLVQGTTYMEMFQPGAYYLFGRDELERRFAGWKIELSRHDSFPAPGGTTKEFSTIVARKA